MKRLATVRARTTIAATLLFAVALTIGGAGLVTVLRSTMIDNVDTALRLRASDIGGLLEGGTNLTDVTIVDEEDSFVQIVADGQVVAASGNVEGEAAISAVSPGRIVTSETHPVDDSAFRILVSEANAPSGPVTVIVGNTLEDTERTVRVTLGTLAAGMPILVLLVAGMTWVLVGRALRPVESIRAEVAEIGSSGLHRRVPQPETADEIGRLAGTMNDMLDRIESGSIRQRRFVSDASHELRTPIATIRHELEVALRGSATTDWPALATSVLEEDLRVQRLIDDLLWLARHDHERDRGPGALVDLDEIVMRQVGRQTPRDGIVVDVSKVSAGQVRGHADDLTRVVQNLLDNAVRHAASRVAVVLGGAEDGAVHLHIDDDGPGVPADMYEAIFERFTRSDEARGRDDGGSGLGLAIASEIVAEHAGTLSVEASTLGGARFTVELSDARSV
ncbi:MAG: ATP-binding protein [Acidimicrobiia bacterium]|nr:ATP-binding protein [Acidimicrobiia bacterium]